MGRGPSRHPPPLIIRQWGLQGPGSIKWTGLGMPMMCSVGPEMEKKVSVGNRCLERRIWKALNIRQTSVIEPKKNHRQRKGCEIWNHQFGASHWIWAFCCSMEHAHQALKARACGRRGQTAPPSSIPTSALQFSKTMHGLFFHLVFTKALGCCRVRGLLQGSIRTKVWSGHCSTLGHWYVFTE